MNEISRRIFAARANGECVDRDRALAHYTEQAALASLTPSERALVNELDAEAALNRKSGTMRAALARLAAVVERANLAGLSPAHERAVRLALKEAKAALGAGA